MSLSFVLQIVALALVLFPVGMALLNAILLPRPKAPDRGGALAGDLVSILIPARDEAAHIAACVQAALASAGVAVEVLVMDDGSRDGTAAIVESLAERDELPIHPGVDLIAHAVERKIGGR